MDTKINVGASVDSLLDDVVLPAPSKIEITFRDKKTVWSYCENQCQHRKWHATYSTRKLLQHLRKEILLIQLFLLKW